MLQFTQGIKTYESSLTSFIFLHLNFCYYTIRLKEMIIFMQSQTKNHKYCKTY